ncbi:MAG: mitochondrial fission ELM1 family protein [Methylocystis sp.]|uniref:mitochondrial fission ELM1 family protein n=1 Tax=Methylocystis sp. TaxID=1911079 RepID=UPI003DA392EF
MRGKATSGALGEAASPLIPALSPQAGRGGDCGGATLRVLTDGRAGHEAQALGLAEALRLAPDIRRVAPGKPYEWLAPFGPPDPRDAPAYTPPYPDLCIAAGRRTIPALRRLKRDSGGRTFTVYLNAPATGPRTADLIVAPRHDRLSGPNVVAPLTPPNRISAERLARARAAPGPRIARLPHPRVAMLIGSAEGIAHDLDHIAASLLSGGFGVMATASRRTPPELIRALGAALAAPGGWFWDGTGDNPYLDMLANADRILVTGDSVNMIGEAVATGVPVHVIEPLAPRRKLRAYVSALEGAGAVRRWRGPFEDWPCAPLNSTPLVADRIAAAYAAFGARLRRGA